MNHLEKQCSGLNHHHKTQEAESVLFLQVRGRMDWNVTAYRELTFRGREVEKYLDRKTKGENREERVRTEKEQHSLIKT